MNKRRELWQEAHGPIPKGYLVHSLNGNEGDTRLDNLAAVPRNPTNVGQVIAPYRVRIQNLERELMLKEKKCL